MGSRWYWPASGGFTSRDTAAVSPVPDSAAASPFGYVGDNPLGGTDPTGHMISGGDCGGNMAACQHYYQQPAPKPDPVSKPSSAPPQPSSSCSGIWGCLWHAVTHPTVVVSGLWHGTLNLGEHLYDTYVHPAVSYVGEVAKRLGSGPLRLIHVAANTLVDLARWGARIAATTIRAGWQAGSRAYHAVTAWAGAGSRTVTSAVRTTWHYVARAATATVTYIKHHAPVFAAFAGCAAINAGLAPLCASAASKPGRALLSRYAAPLAGFAVSAVVFAGCEAAVAVPSAGTGAVAAAAACGGLAGAAGNAVSYAITAAQHGGFTWAGLARAAGLGFITGAATGALIEGAGILAGSLLRSGADDTASALATSRRTDLAAACGGMSFTAGTKVLLADGKKAPISRLRPGQKILATNLRTGKDNAGTIAAVLVHHDTDLYDLRVKAGGRTAVIGTTRSHPFWDQTARRWVKAAALKYGTHLRTPGGGTATALGGYTPRTTTGWMWDLTITSDHDFYVAADTTAILVHNINGCGDGTSVADMVMTNVGSGRAYSVAFRTELPDDAYPGLSRGAHFQAANRQLLQAMNEDPGFASMMEELSPGIGCRFSGLMSPWSCVELRSCWVLIVLSAGFFSLLCHFLRWPAARPGRAAARRSVAGRRARAG
jgi:hypothetical protein